MSSQEGVSFSVNADQASLNAAIADITKAIQSAFKSLSDDVTSTLRKSLADLGSTGFKDLQSGAQASADAIDRLATAVNDVLTRTEAAEAAARSFVDTNNAVDDGILRDLNVQAAELISNYTALTDGSRDFSQEDLSKLRLAFASLNAQVITTRAEFQSTSRVYAQEQLAQSRIQAQELRLRTEQTRSATSQNVATQQRAQAAETAAVRSASQIQVAETQAAARRRVAQFEFAARSIKTIERGLRTIFEQTGRVIATSFDAIGRVASSAATGVTNVFRRSNREITNNYQQAWNDNSSTVENSIRQQETQINGFAQRASRALSSIGVGGAIGLGAAAAGGAFLGDALRRGFDRFTTIQDSTRGLTVLLGDAQQAADLLDSTLQVVTGTPFALDLFAEAAAQLVTFNVEADRIPGILEGIGDAAALRGSQAPEFVSRLVDIVGRIQTQGRLTLNEVNRLESAGVPALQIFGNQLGKTVEEVREMISQGEIGAEAIDLLISGIVDGTDGVNDATVAFGGLAQSLGDTLSGALANFRTARANLGATIIEGFQEPLIALLGLGQALVSQFRVIVDEFLGRITSSRGFQAVVNGITNLSKNLGDIVDRVRPVLRSVADAVLVLGGAFAGLVAIRNASVFVAVFRFALRRLFSPLNVTVAALTAISVGVRQLLAQFPEIAEVGGEAFNAVRAALAPLGAVFGELFRTIIATGGVLRERLAGAFGAFVQLIVRNVVPALQSFTRFVEGTAGPAIERFADFLINLIRLEVGPTLAAGFLILRDALVAVSGFITQRVVPVVVPILRSIGETARDAFVAVRDFVSSSLLPALSQAVSAIRDFARDLVDVLPDALRELGAGLREAFNNRSISDAISAFRKFGGEIGLIAAAVGASIALLLWNPVLGGVALLTAGVVAAFGSDLLDAIRPAAQRVVDAVVDAFNPENLQQIGINILRAIERIGRTLGRIASDPRLLAAVAAFAALAAVVVGAFVVGVVRGVLENVADIATALRDALGEALRQAFSAVFSDPVLAVAVAAGIGALFAGSRALASARLAGRVTATAFAAGLRGGVTPGSVGFGAGPRGFITGLLGTPGQIDAQFAKANAQIDRNIFRSFASRQRVIEGLTGRLATDSQGRALQGNLEGLRQTGRALDELVRKYGSAAVAGSAFRTGLSQIGSALTQVFRGPRGALSLFRNGLNDIALALKIDSRAAFSAAGIALGNAFAASFLGAALFDSSASGADRAFSFAGVAASFATTASLVGPKVALLTTGVGLLGAAFQGASRSAEEARERIQALASIAEQFDDIRGAESAEAVLERAIRDLTSSARELLLRAGLDLPTLVDLIQTGDIDELVRDLEQAGSGPRNRRSTEALAERLGISTSDIRNLRTVLPRLAAEIEAAFSEAEVTVSLLDPDVEGDIAKVRSSVSTVADEIDKRLTEVANANTLTGLGVRLQQSNVNDYLEFLGRRAGEAAEAVEDLNKARIDQLQGNVDAIQREFDEATRRVDLAREAVASFFRPQTESLERTVNDSVLAIQRIGEVVADENLGDNIFDQATISNALLDIGQLATNILSEEFADAEFIDIDAARAALQPLLDAVEALNIPESSKAQIRGEVQGILDSIEDPEFRPLINEFNVAQEALDSLQEQLTAAEYRVLFEVEFNRQITLGATRDEAVAAAREFAQGGEPAGRDYASGIAVGIRNSTGVVQAAARAIANDAVNTVGAVLRIASPSRVGISQGGFYAAGLADGIRAGGAAVGREARRVSDAAVSELGSVTPEFRRVGGNVAAALGEAFFERGISFASSIGSIMDQAAQEAQSRVDQFRTIGREIATALFQQQGSGMFGGTGFGPPEIAAQIAFRNLSDKVGGIGATFAEQGGLGTNQAQVAFLQAGNDIRAYAQTLLDAGRPLNSVVGETRAWRDNLIEAARANGASNSQIQTMIKQLGLSDSQLAEFVKQVRDLEKATGAAADAAAAAAKAEEKAAKAKAEAEEKARKEEEKRLEAERQAARDREQALRDEIDALRAEMNKPATVIPPPVFRDLVINTPAGDPEAVALATVNRVAHSVRGR